MFNILQNNLKKCFLASTSENSSEKKSNSSISQKSSDIIDYSNTSAKSGENNKQHSIESIEMSKKNSTVSRRKENATTCSLNRLSILSTESDKRSSESVEILSSRSATNTECTNSPDSDLNSLSTSVDIKANSESVEVLPDSLVTSPSSVEVLGDWKSDESPHMSPMDEKIIESSIAPILNETTDVSYYNEAFNDGGTKNFFH
jgi:cytoskeletal protein RodZ